MDEPILEQIAEKIVSELNTITLANGYWQDLHAGRTKQTDIDGIDTWITEGGFPYTSGYTIVSQTGDDEADKEDSAGNMSTWDQPFSIMAFVTESDRATESADTKINRIIADVRKILCHTNQLGGLALWLAQGPAAIFRGKGFSGVEIVIAAHYRTKMNVTGTPILHRMRVMKVKLESPKGTYTTPDQAGHVYDLKVNNAAEFIDRRGTGAYRGIQFAGSHGEAVGKCTFRSELKGNGSHGMDPFAAILLQACGLVKATESYALHSNHANDNTISIAAWEGNGATAKKKMLKGCSGNIRITGQHGKPVYIETDFDGLWVAPVDEALPTWAPATRAPINFDSGAITIATNAIKINSFELNLDCKIANRSGDYFMITDYEPVLTIDPEEHVVADYDFHGILAANTQVAVAIPFTDGTDIITITLPKVQFKDLSDAERESLKTLDLVGECQHSTGNDAVTIAVT